MEGGKIKCMFKHYYRVRMDDGKIFTIIYSQLTYTWHVCQGKYHTEESVLGEFKKLSEAKNAIATDFSKRTYPDYKMVWFGTKWGINKDQIVWRDTPPNNWEFDFFTYP